MGFTDIIIIVILVLLLGTIVYFNFIKHSYSPCNVCPKKKACGPKNRESLREYYKKHCQDKEQPKDKSCCK